MSTKTFSELSNLIHMGEVMAKNPDAHGMAIQVRGDRVISNVTDSKGKVLNNCKILNNASASNPDFGSNIDITTLTKIKQDIVEQKFFKTAPSDFMPVTIGFNPWGDVSQKFSSFETGDKFEDGDVDLARNSRIAQSDVAIAPQSKVLKKWAFQMDYNLFELRTAQTSNNWNLITAREKALKTRWDLGTQNIAFLGHSTDTRVKGLYNQSGLTVNSTLIPTAGIADASDAEFDTIKKSLVSLFYTNTNSTEVPDTFLMPTDDYFKLTGSSATSAFPIENRFKLLKEALVAASGNENFKIGRLPYGQTAFSGLAKDRYILYRNALDVLELDIPIPYTSLTAETSNNFQFDSVSYGQYSGVLITRPLEVMYFDLP